jgi:hypothetical protein
MSVATYLWDYGTHVPYLSWRKYVSYVIEREVKGGTEE